MVVIVKEKNNSNFYCAYFLDNYETGKDFITTPSHLTIVPPFVTDRRDFLDVVNDITGKNSPFELEIGDSAMFGPNNDTPVFLIKPNDILHMMHRSLLDGMRQQGILLPDGQYAGDNYRPHITIGGREDLHSGALINFNHISVVEKHEGTKTILARYAMRGEK